MRINKKKSKKKKKEKDIRKKSKENQEKKGRVNKKNTVQKAIYNDDGKKRLINVIIKETRENYLRHWKI